VSEAQWRCVLRQLIALGHVQTEGEFNTLELTDSARDRAQTAAGKPPPLPLDDAATALRALKAWRAEVAANTTCRPTSCSTTPRWREMARSGVGAKKLQAYGDDILRVLRSG
jgi:ATP-dependent DNA helicase RecQ